MCIPRKNEWTIKSSNEEPVAVEMFEDCIQLVSEHFCSYTEENGQFIRKDLGHVWFIFLF